MELGGDEEVWEEIWEEIRGGWETKRKCHTKT